MLDPMVLVAKRQWGRDKRQALKKEKSRGGFSLASRPIVVDHPWCSRQPTKRAIEIAVLCLALVGCTTYEPMPLDTTIHFAHSLSELRTTPAGSTQSAVDITKPLRLADIAFLAVANNPDLIAARTERGIDEAQLIQAGLLPNPSLAASYGFLISGPASFDAWSLGLTEDLKAIITSFPQKESARYALFQADAEELWKEWELITKASLLYVDVVEGEKLGKVVGGAREVFRERYDRSMRALDQGNTDLTAATPDIAALSDIEKQYSDAERTQLGKRDDLNALLGLAPDVTLTLAENVDLPAIDHAKAEALLTDLPQRRPDLVALQLGYKSEEAKLRAAIWGQFPALTFGGTGASDTSHVVSAGPQITLDLPIFNRNQGNIAIEQATRKKLYAEFNARQTATIIEIEASLAEEALLERQMSDSTAKLPAANRAATFAENAYRAGNIDARGYADLMLVRMSKQQEIIGIEQAIFEHRVAVAGLLGAGLPDVTYPTADREHK
jgi:outer membrane protein TolC